jgi:Cytochrome P460
MDAMRAALVGLLVLGAFSMVGFAFGSGTGPEPSSTPSARAPYPGVPAYIAGYKRWHKLNRKPIRGGSPAHGGTKNVYVSKPLRAGHKRYAAGTIIVKEAVNPGESFVHLIAVSRKIKGFNPRHNDWQMIEWSRASASARFSEVARGQICYSCHVGARSRDYVWTKR